MKTKGYVEGVPRNFPAVEPMLLAEGLMRIEKVGKAECRLMDAQGTFECVERAARKDPCLLLAERPV